MGGVIAPRCVAQPPRRARAEAARGGDGVSARRRSRFEIYLEHYKGSFGDKWMWTPIVLTPPLTAAGVAGVVSERAARDRAAGRLGALLPRRPRSASSRTSRACASPGGFGEATYNLVMGPPLLAPGSLCLVGALGLAGRDRQARALSDCEDFRDAGHLPKRRGDRRSPTRRAAAPAARDDAADARPLPRLRRARAGGALGRGHAARSCSTASRTCRRSASSTAREAATLRRSATSSLAQDAEPRIPVLALRRRQAARGRGSTASATPTCPTTARPGGSSRAASTRRRARAARRRSPPRRTRPAGRRSSSRFATGRAARRRLGRRSTSRARGRSSCATCSQAFYSHPWAWNEIGFGGPAYPRGYARFGSPHLDGGEREAWEGARGRRRRPGARRRSSGAR